MSVKSRVTVPVGNSAMTPSTLKIKPVVVRLDIKFPQASVRDNYSNASRAASDPSPQEPQRHC